MGYRQGLECYSLAILCVCELQAMHQRQTIPAKD